MKIDRNLIDKKFDESDIKDFKDFLNTKIDFSNNAKGFKKFLFSPYAYLVVFLFLGIAVFDFFVLSNYINSKFVIGLLITFIAFAILLSFSIFYVRSDFASKTYKNVNILEITKKWFSYYGIKEENTTSTEIKENHKKLIKKYKQVPNDAIINSISKSYNIKNNEILSSFIDVKWHWKTYYEDKDGNKKTINHYKNQFYLFEEGFKDKWKDFCFTLKKYDTFFKRKHETLENVKFNKEFNYSYNDPVKLRMLFTVATQEMILNKFQKSSVEIFKEKDVLVLTSITNKIDSNFTPFEFNNKFFERNLEDAQKNLHDDFISDYKSLMYFMGHSRLLFSLYK